MREWEGMRKKKGSLSRENVSDVEICSRRREKIARATVGEGGVNRVGSEFFGPQIGGWRCNRIAILRPNSSERSWIVTVADPRGVPGRVPP